MTLGISTNTRLLGLGVIQQGCLLDYRISPHKQAWSPVKATRILSSLEPCVRRYSPKKVVLSIPPEHHQTPQWKQLVRRLEGYFNRQHIPVHKVPTTMLCKVLCPGEKKVKKALMQALVDRFPELCYCYSKEIRNKRKYYIKLFEAVAAALLGEEL